MGELVKFLKNNERISAEEALVATELAKRTAECLPNGYAPLAEYDAVCFAGHVTEQELTEFLALSIPCELIDLSVGKPVGEEVLRLVPAEVARRHFILPYAMEKGRLKIVCCDPFNLFVQDDVKFLTGLNVVVAIAPKNQITAAIEDYYFVGNDEEILASPAEEMEAAFPSALEEEPSDQAEDEGIDIEELERSVKEAPVVRLVNLILVDAVKRGASEIHIEPYEKQFDIRYRIDGELHAFMRPPLRLRNAIVSRIKIMSELDIAERRKVQNGKIVLLLGKDKQSTFYVSTLPVLFGEKVVLRVRDTMKATPKASDFFLFPADVDELKRELARPGIKVVYGLSRSGKSAMFRFISSEMSAWGTQNVLAVGDVNVSDFAIGNVNCVAVDPRNGLTAARVMAEACYGQSADVIMMDGFVDADTAKAAIDTALSGKVVILSMAAGSAGEVRNVMAKLIGDDARLDLALNLFLGVRLLRRLCPDCKASFTDQDTLAKAFPPTELPVGEKMRVAVGCHRCNNRGYAGQVGICEIAKDVTGKTVGSSMMTLMRQLLESGATSFEEVMRQKP